MGLKSCLHRYASAWDYCHWIDPSVLRYKGQRHSHLAAESLAPRMMVHHLLEDLNNPCLT